MSSAAPLTSKEAISSSPRQTLPFTVAVPSFTVYCPLNS